MYEKLFAFSNSFFQCLYDNSNILHFKSRVGSSIHWRGDIYNIYACLSSSVPAGPPLHWSDPFKVSDLKSLPFYKSLFRSLTLKKTGTCLISFSPQKILKITRIIAASQLALTATLDFCLVKFSFYKSILKLSCPEMSAGVVPMLSRGAFATYFGGQDLINQLDERSGSIVRYVECGKIIINGLNI